MVATNPVARVRISRRRGNAAHGAPARRSACGAPRQSNSRVSRGAGAERVANPDPPPAHGPRAGRSGARRVGRTYSKSPPSLARRSGTPSASARCICHLQRHIAVRSPRGRIDRPLSEGVARLRDCNNTCINTAVRLYTVCTDSRHSTPTAVVHDR